MKRLHSVKQKLQNLKAAFTCTVPAALSTPTFAAGGLDEATKWVDDVTSWAYGFLGAAVLLYCIYLVIMALLEKKQWGDVFVGMGKTAAAGGIIVAATYAWSIWGS